MNQEPRRNMEGGFTPKGWRHSSPLPFITRPHDDPNFAVFGADQDGFEAYVLNTVLNQMDAELDRAIPNETFGLLAGRVMRDSGGPYTMVLACQNARVDELKANPAHVGISATGHSKLRQRLETTAYGLDLVGWYHSHPRFPARFSSVDMTEQSTLKDPNHLGIVVSGIDDLKPYGVYRGPAAILLAPQAITRRVVPSLTPKPIVVSNDQLAVPNSILQPGVGASFIPSRHGAKSAAPSQSLPVNSGFQKKLSFRQLLLVASALSALAILLWTNYRIYSIENKLSSLADIKAVTAKDDPARPSASPSVDNSKAAENPAPTPANEKSIASLDPPANPKLPVSKSPDKSRTKRAGVGSGNRRNANRSSGTVGGQAVKQGPVRRSAMPKPTPKPISMPTIKTLPKPLPRASVNTND